MVVTFANPKVQNLGVFPLGEVNDATGVGSIERISNFDCQ